MRYTTRIGAVLLFLAACDRAPAPHEQAAAPAASEPTAAAPAAAPADVKAGPGFTPRVDHHLHLLSAAGADSRLAAVSLPVALDRLVRARERHWNDAAGLAGLFATDAALFTGMKWLTGRDAIAAHLAENYTGPYRFKSVTVRVDGPAAQVAGFLVADDGSNGHFGFFHLGLRAGPGGAWQIVSEQQLFPGPVLDQTVSAAQLIAMMDAAGITRGVVLSDAYYFDLDRPEPRPDELERVREENDWTASQVAQFPDRLVAFCSFNPLKPYALAELDRCAASGSFRGLKLHFNGAQLDFDDPAAVDRVREVMAAANRHRLPMIIHVRSSNAYGREHAEVFLRRLIAAAPDVPIQIAHLWGGESFAGPALAVYADAVATGDPVAKNLYFDVSGLTSYGKPEHMPEIVAQIRRIGLSRILYASDAPPAEAWQALVRDVPLTEAELRTIADNVAPYMRDR